MKAVDDGGHVAHQTRVFTIALVTSAPSRVSTNSNAWSKCVLDSSCTNFECCGRPYPHQKVLVPAQYEKPGPPQRSDQTRAMHDIGDQIHHIQDIPYIRVRFLTQVELNTSFRKTKSLGTYTWNFQVLSTLLSLSGDVEILDMMSRCIRNMSRYCLILHVLGCLVLFETRFFRHFLRHVKFVLQKFQIPRKKITDISQINQLYNLSMYTYSDHA